MYAWHVIASIRMVHAYVMIETAAGESEETIESVRALPEIAEAHVVAGDYDIIAEVVVEEVYAVHQAVVSKLQAIDGIVDTRTYVSLE